jgi:alanyl-tRNA synthetase
VRLVSVLPVELPAGIERLQADAKETNRQLKDLLTRLATFEGAALAARAERRGNIQVVIEALEGWDQNGLKAIASAIAARSGYAAVLFSVPQPSAVVIARAADGTIDSAAVLKKLIERFGGKGGGRPDLAQGGGLQGPAGDIITCVRELLGGGPSEPA